VAPVPPGCTCNAHPKEALISLTVLCHVVAAYVILVLNSYFMYSFFRGCRLSIKRDKQHVLFGGTKLLQTMGDKGAHVRTPDGGCLAVVLRTGFGTAQGEGGPGLACPAVLWPRLGWAVRTRLHGLFGSLAGPGFGTGPVKQAAPELRQGRAGASSPAAPLPATGRPASLHSPRHVAFCRVRLLPSPAGQPGAH
jgi:hypothetical protein